VLLYFLFLREILLLKITSVPIIIFSASH
jgi:hypothetical protein